MSNNSYWGYVSNLTDRRDVNTTIMVLHGFFIFLSALWSHCFDNYTPLCCSHFYYHTKYTDQCTFKINKLYNCEEHYKNTKSTIFFAIQVFLFFFFFALCFFLLFLLSRCVNSLARLANTLSLLTYGSLFRLHSNVWEECIRNCETRKFKKCLLSHDNSSLNKQWIYGTWFQTQQMEWTLPTLYSLAEAVKKMPRQKLVILEMSDWSCHGSQKSLFAPI